MAVALERSFRQPKAGVSATSEDSAIHLARLSTTKAKFFGHPMSNEEARYRPAALKPTEESMKR